MFLLLSTSPAPSYDVAEGDLEHLILQLPLLDAGILGLPHSAWLMWSWDQAQGFMHGRKLSPSSSTAWCGQHYQAIDKERPCKKKGLGVTGQRTKPGPHGAEIPITLGIQVEPKG